MKDAIERQHPKVIALEGYLFSNSNKVKSFHSLHQAMDGMPLTLNKIQMGEDLMRDKYPFEERLPLYLPIMQYHSRWSELSEKDFIVKGDAYVFRGGKPNFSNKPFEAPPLVTKGMEEYERRQRVYNGVGSYLEEKGIPFLNYAFLNEEIGLDYATDFRDFGHFWGAFVCLSG